MRIVLAGALGEVGCSLHGALTARGHEVWPVSARAPIDREREVLGLPDVAHLVESGSVDVVVQAGGPGDHREIERDHIRWSSSLLNAVGGIPAILISTTRVLEGYNQRASESALPRPATSYGQANADHEQVWSSNPDSRVLRLVNFFCPPSSEASPQTNLLPWSLLLEGWHSGLISVRSAPQVAKEFVGAGDVARAIEVLAADRSGPPVVVCGPGLTATMEQLTQCAIKACRAGGREDVAATFGGDSPTGRGGIDAQWLTQRGWASDMTLDRMAEEMSRWLVEWGPMIPHSGRD